MAEPFPKSAQLARGERRYRRKVADARTWTELRSEKLFGERCRCCGARADSLHHLVSRSRGGDDVADNLVPLCGDGTRGCHGSIERRTYGALHALALNLTDGEYAYVVGKLGEGAMGRLFGV